MVLLSSNALPELKALLSEGLEVIFRACPSLYKFRAPGVGTQCYFELIFIFHFSEHVEDAEHNPCDARDFEHSI